MQVESCVGESGSETPAPDCARMSNWNVHECWIGDAPGHPRDPIAGCYYAGIRERSRNEPQAGGGDAPLSRGRLTIPPTRAISGAGTSHSFPSCRTDVLRYACPELCPAEKVSQHADATFAETQGTYMRYESRRRDVHCLRAGCRGGLRNKDRQTRQIGADESYWRTLVSVLGIGGPGKLNLAFGARRSAGRPRHTPLCEHSACCQIAPRASLN